MECSVCLNDEDDVVHLHCGHGCCECCWSRYVSTCVKDGKVEIGCIVVTCSVKMSEQEVLRYLVTDEEKEKYFRFKGLKQLEANPDVRWCRNPECGVPVHGYVTEGWTPRARRIALKYGTLATTVAVAAFLTTLLTQWMALGVAAAGACGVGLMQVIDFFEVFESCGGSQRISQCSKCSTQSCYDCRLPPHEGECLQAMTHELKTWFSCDDKMRAPCHGCKTLIELYDGCNHMTCLKCGYQFCMLCGEDISANVSRHYSQTSCQRYNGEMTQEWKDRRWDIASIRPRLSASQQDAILYTTAVVMLLLAATVCIKHISFEVVSKVITVELSASVGLITTAGLAVNNNFQKVESYEPLFPLRGWLLSVFVAVNFELVVNSLQGLFGTSTIAYFVEGIASTLCLIVALCLTVSTVCYLHVHRVRNPADDWTAAIEPSWTRPLKDLNLLTNIYAMVYLLCKGTNPYCWTFSVVLCFVASLCCFVACFAPSNIGMSEAPFFWGAYRQVLKGVLTVTVFVVITVSGASSWLLYYANLLAVAVMPLTLCPHPFDATMLGAVCKKFSLTMPYPTKVLPRSTFKKGAFIVLVGAFLELTIIDLMKGGAVLDCVSMLAWYHNLPVFAVCACSRVRRSGFA